MIIIIIIIIISASALLKKGAFNFIKAKYIPLAYTKLNVNGSTLVGHTFQVLLAADV